MRVIVRHMQSISLVLRIEPILKYFRECMVQFRFVDPDLLLQPCSLQSPDCRGDVGVRSYDSIYGTYGS